MNNDNPRVYISYSHGSPSHNKWVQKLAESLRLDGVDIILDQWNLQPGDDIRQTQKKWMTESDSVILILTDGYLRKVEKLGSGVGFEFTFVIDYLASKKKCPRIIPLDCGLLLEPLPAILQGRYILKFIPPKIDTESYKRLVDALLAREKEPVLGKPDAKPLKKIKPFDKRSQTILRRLKVNNFRGFKSFELTFPLPKQTSNGQWTVLLGDNGVGKTSLLWAIALALTNEELGHAVLAGLPSLLKRTGSKGAQVIVDANEYEFDCQIKQVQQREKLITHSEVSDFPVFGYGTGRGSALGGANRAVELNRPLDSIGTLFGLPSNLIHAETWLRELEHRSLKRKSSKDEDLFTCIIDTLLQLLPGVNAMEVMSNDVIVRGPIIGECSIASLSDGYLTTIGWVLDLIARWTHEAERADIKIKPGFNKQMTGIVLIDELDLHLHPRWQMHIISDLRKAFPKMSFIVTTHNPLTLLGAEPGEIHVIRRDEDQLKVTQEDISPGIRADQVLTGIWFGLSSTLDEETRSMLDGHRRMLSKGTKRSDAKRKKLERDLRQRLGSFADTSEDRLALEIAAEHMNDGFRSLTPNEREEVQKKIKHAMEVGK